MIVTIMVASNRILQSLFVPKDCLQGEEIPIHVIWDRNINLNNIKILYPDHITLTEIYNLEENGYTDDLNILTLNKFKVNGYVGLVFKSEMEDNFSIDKVIKISICDPSGEKIEIERTIHLFRPEICVSNIPERIFVEFDTDTKKFKIDNKIIVRNKGDGTAIINLSIKKESELHKEISENSDKFVTKFWNDLEKKIYRVKEDFQMYEELLDNFIQIGKNPTEYLENSKKLKEIFDGLETAFQNNEHFMNEFGKAFLGAYLKNINIITEIESFNIYLNSIELGKILLQDAVDVIKISPLPKKLSSQLNISDVASNTYKPIDISTIEFKSNIEGELPIYSIFEWK